MLEVCQIRKIKRIGVFPLARRQIRGNLEIKRDRTSSKKPLPKALTLPRLPPGKTPNPALPNRIVWTISMEIVFWPSMPQAVHRVGQINMLVLGHFLDRRHTTIEIGVER